MGGGRDSPLELRVAMLSRYGFGSYREILELDMREVELLEHIAYTLNKSEELQKWQTQNLRR